MPAQHTSTIRNVLATMLGGTLLFAAGAAQAAIPAGERAVLQALYTQTNGTGWWNDSGWGGASGTECSWHGITCDAGQTHVTNIDLANNTLVGTLPANLNNMTALQTFWVGGNQLTGTIPPLSGLTALQGFIVEFNQLTGTIPKLSGLTALQVFNVADNQLTGVIPPSLSTLTALQVFVASHNQLTGLIPPLNGLTALTDFQVETNQLTGAIPPLNGLKALNYFGADNNQLTGTIPPLSGLTALLLFSVFNNHLTGPAPTVPNPNGLHAGASGLCPNQLDPSTGTANDLAWDTATASTPWSAQCAAAAAVPTASVPTLSEWGLMLLTLCLGFTAAWHCRLS